MQKAITALFAIILIAGGGYFLYSITDSAPQGLDPLREKIVTPESIKQIDKKEPVQEALKKEIPEELYEQLDVTDLEFLDTSIANQPDLWRAFLNSPAPMSDPFFEFGCLEYQDTGARLTVNLFTDNADRYWVAEVVDSTLIGIGELSFIDYDRVTAYKVADIEIACLELLKRQYEKYYLLSDRVELSVSVQGGESFPLGYELILFVDNVYMPLPSLALLQLSTYTGAGREPVLIANRYILGYGEEGISFFDLRTWEYANLFGIDYENVRGISRIYSYLDKPLIAFAHENWDGDPAFGAVFVYDLTEGKEYKQYMRNAQLGWMMGSNEVFSLENREDIKFINESTLQIVEYPNFDQDITDGNDPYMGETEITNWEFLPFKK